MLLTARSEICRCPRRASRLLKAYVAWEKFKEMKRCIQPKVDNERTNAMQVKLYTHQQQKLLKKDLCIAVPQEGAPMAQYSGQAHHEFLAQLPRSSEST
eukprot:687372-Amphidinium_carterae.1